MIFPRSKKAQTLSTLQALLFATVAVIVIVIAIVAVVRVLGIPATLPPEISSVEAQASNSLDAYLASQVGVVVEGKTFELEIIDLIRLARIDEKYTLILQEQTNNIFNKVYGENWGIKIDGVFEHYAKLPKESAVNYLGAYIATSERTIPSDSGNIKILLMLS